jgi:DNA-binding PadR family transcriptional regulator
MPDAVVPKKEDIGLKQSRNPSRGLVLSAESEKMLVRFANATQGATLAQAVEGMELSKAKSDYFLDQLSKHNFIRVRGGRMGGIGGPILYSATSDGREYLANAGLL